jgi:hypothetical protein
MDYILIVVFTLPMVWTILLMSIIVTYLNNKAIIKRSVQDQIQVDLARITIMYVYYYCIMVIARDICGPLESLDILNIALWILQCIFNMGFNCIISLVFIQFCNIFGLTVLNDWQESHRLMLTRFLVISLGILIGTVLCSVGGGSCRRSPIYNYFIIESLHKDVIKTSLLSGISWISYGIIILICQISVEVKRFLLNRADQRADDLALNAKRQLQQAVSKLKNHTPAELGIHNIISDLQQSAQGSNSFQHFTATVVTKTLKRMFPTKTCSTNFINYQKGQAEQQPPEHNQTHNDENTIFNEQLLNVENGMISLVEENLEDVISVVEESIVEEENKTSDLVVNNVKRKKRLNNLVNYQGACQAWQQTDVLSNKEIENPQIPHSDESSKSLSRDRVKNQLYLFNF